MKAAAGWLSALALAAAACGGGSPAGPGPVPTTPPAPVFRDGWTEQSVTADIAPAAPGLGAMSTVRAPGYLTREAPFDGSPFYLWPQDEAYVRALVYSEFSPGQRLARWTTAFTVRPLAGHEDEIAAAVAEAARATGLALTVGLAGAVDVVVDPAATAYASSHREFAGYTVTSCRITFRSESGIDTATVLHELGHCLGLGHSPAAGDVMQTGVYIPSAFSERERVALRMMYRWRKPGNAAPDRE